MRLLKNKENIELCANENLLINAILNVVTVFKTSVLSNEVDCARNFDY